MNASLLEQLQAYGDHFVSGQDSIHVEDIARRESVPYPANTPPRRWGVALATATVVLVILGGLIGGWRLLTRDATVTGTPIARVSSTTLQSTATTSLEPPATTVAPSATRLPTTTTVAPTTVTSIPVVPTTLAPYEGPVLDLSDGWKRVLDGSFTAGAAAEEHGVVAFDTSSFPYVAWFSADGILWEEAPGYEPTDGDPPQGISEAAGGGFGFIAAGYGDKNVFYSPDGTRWVNAKEAVGPNAAGQIAINDETFVAFGGAVAWTGDRFVTLTSNNNGLVTSFSESADGKTWVAGQIPRVGFIGQWDLFVAGSGDELVLFGTDATTPTPQPLEAWYSLDGGSWAQATIPAPNVAGGYQTRALLHTDVGYFAAGSIETLTDSNTAFVMWSPDGATWFEYTFEDRWFLDLAYHRGSLYVIGTGVWKLDLG